MKTLTLKHIGYIYHGTITGTLLSGEKTKINMNKHKVVSPNIYHGDIVVCIQENNKNFKEIEMVVVEISEYYEHDVEIYIGSLLFDDNKSFETRKDYQYVI